MAAEIPGADITERPVFYQGRGRVKGSFVRVGDSDEPMTEYEVYSYEAYRKKYQDDIRVIERATFAALNQESILNYIELLKIGKPKLAAVNVNIRMYKKYILIVSFTIDNYFNHVANKEQDMAVELIIQVGDRDFWKENEDKIRRAAILYSVLLHELREQIPQFVIANAVIHLDEDSPHMHVVGVPVASGYKKGLSKQVCKRKVFTKEILSDVLQGSFREFASNKSKIVFGEEFREKSKGRNHDLTVAEYKASQENQRYEQLREKAEEEELKIDLLQKENIDLEEQHDFLANRVISSQLACNDVDWKIERRKRKRRG